MIAEKVRPCSGVKSPSTANVIASSLARGIKRSIQSRKAWLSPAKASSTAFSTNSLACGFKSWLSSVRLSKMPNGLPVGMPDSPGLNVMA